MSVVSVRTSLFRVDGTSGTPVPPGRTRAIGSRSAGDRSSLAAARPRGCVDSRGAGSTAPAISDSAARWRNSRSVSPLIRPSATFSRVGEKGHVRVTFPALGRRDMFVSRLPRWGEGTCSCHVSRVGEKEHVRVTFPALGRRDMFVSRFPCWGEGTWGCYLSRGRERSLESRLREPSG